MLCCASVVCKRVGKEEKGVWKGLFCEGILSRRVTGYCEVVRRVRLSRDGSVLCTGGAVCCSILLCGLFCAQGETSPDGVVYLVECCFLKPCWFGCCVMVAVMIGKIIFSSVLAIGESSEMGL